MSDLNCVTCGFNFPVEAFHLNRSTTRGYQTSCRICNKLRDINNRAPNGKHTSEKCLSREHYRLYDIRVAEEWVMEGPLRKGDKALASFVRHILTHVGLPINKLGEIDWKLTIDRRNNNHGYFAGNLRWATPQEQAMNTRRGVPVF